MKKFLVLLLSLMMVLGTFSVAQADESSTIIDWSNATELDINGGALVSGFADLSYWNVPSSGVQSVKDGMFQIEILQDDYSCFQFSFNSAFSEENAPKWAEHNQLRFYMENNTDSEISMTLYLYINDYSAGYGANYPMTNGYGVYLVWADNTEEIYEPDYRYDDSFANRYYYIPEGFKGWVVVPSTFCSEFGDDLVGWMHSYWADPATLDYSIASMDKAMGLSADIRADGASEGEVCFGNFVLENEGTVIEPIEPSTTNSEPAVEETEPAQTEEATQETATDAPTTEPTQGAQDTNGDSTVIIIVAIAAVVVIAGVVVGIVLAKKAKKKAE